MPTTNRLLFDYRILWPDFPDWSGPRRVPFRQWTGASVGRLYGPGCVHPLEIRHNDLLVLAADLAGFAAEHRQPSWAFIERRKAKLAGLLRRYERGELDPGIRCKEMPAGRLRRLP